MNIKTIFISILLLVVFLSIGNAATDIQTAEVHVTSGSGNGWWTDTANMPNDQNIVGNYTYYTSYAYSRTNAYYGTCAGLKACINPTSCHCDGNNVCTPTWCYSTCYFNTRPSAGFPAVVSSYGSGESTGSLNANYYACIIVSIQGVSSGAGSYGHIKGYVIYTDGHIYNISGTTGCLSNVSLYYDNVSTWDYMSTDYLADDFYSFTVTPNQEFKLIFDDGHFYEFNVTDDNIVYDYNGCITTKYNFTESCGNLIPDSEGFYIEKIGSTVHAANNFYVPSGILSISQSPADNIYVSANPFSGQIGWFLDPITNDTTYTLTNPIISWSLRVIVQNESTGALIDDARVRVNQSCYCTDGYSVRQKLTTNGHADFTDMSLQDAH
jgi:hypothetical protein